MLRYTSKMAIPFRSRSTSIQLRPPIIQVRVLPLVVLYFCACLTIPIVVHGWTQTRIRTKQSEVRVRVPVPVSSFITNRERNANDVVTAVTVKSASKSKPRSTPTLSFSKSQDANNEEDAIQHSIQTCAITFALGVACFLLLPVPSSYAATTSTLTTTTEDYGSYNCPQFFASQTLGIQNVLRQPLSPSTTVTSPPSALAAVSRSSKSRSTSKNAVSPQTTTTIGSSSYYSYCPTSRDGANENGGDGEDNYSVRGLIYLPSNNDKGNKSKEGHSSSLSSLIITVRSSENPSSSIPLMGAKIPMPQIESFPISFALSSKSPNNNFLMKDRDWEQSIFDASNELYVTAKICSTSSSISSSSGCKSPVFQGSGISRKLLVPNNKFGADEDDFRTVRGAASIRLSEASTPDTLYTW